VIRRIMTVKRKRRVAVKIPPFEKGGRGFVWSTGTFFESRTVIIR